MFNHAGSTMPATGARRLSVIAVAALVAAFAAAPAMAQGKPVTVYCADFPPACNAPGNPRAGMMVDVGTAVLARAGFSSTVQILPWKRAQEVVRAGTNGVIVYFARTPDRAAAYRWLGITNEIGFSFVRKAGDPAIDSLEQAAALQTIGISFGSNVREWLLDHGIAPDKLSEGSNDSTIQKLRFGRIDAFFGADVTMPSLYLETTGERPVVGKAIYTDPIWMAAGLGFPGDSAARITAAIEAMKADGSIQKIIAGYR